MQLILEGQILTPIITKQPIFHFMGCKAIIKNPRRRYYSKITTHKPMYPYAFICYLGTIELQFSCKTKSRAKEKLQELLQVNQISRFQSGGLGRVQWLQGRLESSSMEQLRKFNPIRIRKGLPHILPEHIRELLRYALLHDFVHTPRHQSKIYSELTLENESFLERLRQHHDYSDDPFLKKFQLYDQHSARLTRQVRSPTGSRYNWQAKKTNIDFQQLSHDIVKASGNVWKLYEFVYKNKELEKISESIEYGHSSLRNHLLVLVNLIVQDFLDGKLENLSHGWDP